MSEERFDKEQSSLMPTLVEEKSSLDSSMAVLPNKKVCPSCGKMVDNDSVVCMYCGNIWKGQPVPNSPSHITIVNQQAQIIQKTSVFAVLSFAFSLIGVVLFPIFFESLSFVFGIIGVVQCTVHSDRYNGRAFAIIGLIISIFYILFLLYILKIFSF